MVAEYSAKGATGTAIGMGDASGDVTFTGADVFACVAGPPGTGAAVPVAVPFVAVPLAVPFVAGATE